MYQINLDDIQLSEMQALNYLASNTDLISAFGIDIKPQNLTIQITGNRKVEV